MDAPSDLSAARFLSEARTAESAKARSREHWLRQQAREGATFAGILRVLSDRGGTVRATAGSGHEFVGAIGAVASELVEVVDPDRSSWMVMGHITSVHAVEPGFDAGVASDDRGATSTVTIAGLLAGLAEDRSDVQVLTSSGEEVSGRLVGSGADVITVRAPSGRLSYVPTATIAVVRRVKAPG